ncbi:MAG TPA: HAMP domain-containing sensor histidine kinase [Anaerolineales bacterium]|nr:HAMP domain-containing sensor histidine kinase [Anaerolineales bacterium]
MFRGLRLQLTLLYLTAALGLILLLGGGTYLLLHSYFQASTDLALRFRMAQEFQARGLSLPPDLADAASAWSAQRAPAAVAATPTAAARRSEGDEGDGGEDGEGGAGQPTGEAELAETERYDGELTAIFALPVTAQAQLISNPNPFAPPVAPNAAAVEAALAKGSDLRTVHASDGSEVRLLTYRLSGPDGAQALQLGRTTSDQGRALNRLLAILLGLGTLGAASLAISSWWLAGRSLLPAERAWEKQQAFVANASHELRTPLTLIRASADVARRGTEAGDDRFGLLGDVLQETDHMGKLVEDLLLLSRLDAGRLELSRQPVEMAGLLQDLGRQVGRVAEAKGIVLDLGPLDGTALADPTRLRQVLLALIDNALQNTPAGGSVRLAAQPQGKTVTITVSDTGPGLSDQERSRVFDRFYRAQGARPGGSGLGLAIAKGLVEAQHGRLALESGDAGGIRAVVTLPGV